MGRGSALQNLDIFGILVVKLGEIDHQACQERLTAVLRCGGQPAGKTKADFRVLFVRFHRSRKAQHIVDCGVHQANGAGDGGADDIGPGFSVPAVSQSVKPADAVALHMERNGSHTLDGDLADLDLGVGLTMALTLTVTLLGIVLEDTNLLTLTVLDDLGLHGSTSHDGSAEGGLFAVQNCQDLVELHGVTGLVVQLFNENHVALCDLVLLAASFNNCMHMFQLLQYGLAVGGGIQKDALQPIQSGLFSITAKSDFVKQI